ncbi:MAG: HEAT repeat domain-containing protein [Limisphaerales bacterium]
MKKSQKQIAVGVLVGLLIFIGVIWLLSQTLGNVHEGSFARHSLTYWRQELDSRDSAASNQAYAVVNTQIVPQLIDTMFHDTNDSKIRMAAVGALNRLPGIYIYFTSANERRSGAAESLGELGPAAKSALPDLIKALKGEDVAVRGSALLSLGKIRSEPETVIPLLIPYLEDDNLDVAAAKALAEFGGLAKPAVPKLLPLLRAKDVDDRAAAIAALKRIDPIAAARAGIK